MIFNLSDLTIREKQHYLQHLVAPRPIGFVSTTDKHGAANLSPFSFFNIFSNHPPILIFSPVRRVRNNTVKHTLENIREIPEAVINILTYDMVQQASLASCEYPKGVDEFLKAGFTKEPASLVKPPMVKESKAKLECKVLEIKSLGDEGGAAQLVICEALVMHIDDDWLSADKKMDQRRMDLVARLGADWYARITPASLLKIKKPNVHTGIGIDALPAPIRASNILTGHYLAQLANVDRMPQPDPAFYDDTLDAIIKDVSNNAAGMAGIAEQHRLSDRQKEKAVEYAQKLIDEENIDHAWQVLLWVVKALKA